MDKVEVIRAMSETKTVRLVRGFIGAIVCYRRFIPVIVDSLNILTKKYARFKRKKDCQSAFDSLKNHLTTILSLTYTDLSKAIILYTDASYQCIGAVLTQTCQEKAG